MTDTTLGPATIELLREIRNAEGSRIHRADIDYGDKMRLQRLEALLEQEMIAPADDELVSGDSYLGIVYNSLVITAKGIDFLDSLDQAAADKAKAERREKKQRGKEARRSWYQLLIGGLLGIVGVILGAYLQARTGWLDWLTDLLP